MKNRLTALLALLAITAIPAAAQNGKPDAEGFIRDWLVLGPIPVGGSAAADEIDKKQFPEEAQPAAKEGARQKVRDNLELNWKKIATSYFYIDFREIYPELPEEVLAVAVAYVVSPDEKSGLTLKMNSNDQGKAYLNGKELVKFKETRTLEKEAEDSAANVTLKKGVNIVVLKVANESNNWQGSIRFVDKAGKPVTDFKVEMKP